MKIIEGFNNAKTLLSRRALDAAESDIEREKTVRQIVADIRRRGDAAIFDYTQKFDGVKLDSLEVTQEQVSSAYREVDKELITAMELAAARITDYHEEQKKMLLHDNVKSKLGWLMRPLERI